jgi:predicted SAM-dependent methyltransferase
MSGPVILNLGCGTHTSAACVNIDWSIHLQLKRWHLAWVAGSERRKKIDAMAETVVVHDLTKGIPVASESVDAVYHSHVLEHIEREGAQAFMREILRVLKPDGIQRIVVPDLELLARQYLEHFGEAGHDDRVAGMIEQMVRGEAYGTSTQRPLRRRVERLVLGDARKRGEAHRWMYDRTSLAELLTQTGFVDIEVASYDVSAIPCWNEIGLDALEDGTPYKPGSLYVEARRPVTP